MIGAKSAEKGGLWKDGVLNTTDKPVLSNVNVIQTGPLDVGKQMGVGFFDTLSDEASDNDVGLSKDLVKVSNLRFNNIKVDNQSTTTKYDQTLVNGLVSSLGKLLGGVVDLLAWLLTFGSVDAGLRKTLTDVLDARKNDPTALATGAIAGRVVGNVEISDCELIGDVIVQSPNNDTGGFTGFSVLLYPTFSSYLNEKNSSKVVSNYDAESVKLSNAEKEQMLADARAYNQEMLGNIDLIDPFSQTNTEIDERYQDLLNVDGSGMMGYIRIPKIKVELPIYHGTSETVLQAGVGHFWGTSLPVGGESTHTVLTGHRGLPTKTLFTNMDKLKVGDIFYIKVLGETLAYKIDQILTVLPEETEALSIEPGQDYATLVTCTPYAINTHRLLVRGERIPYEEAIKEVPDQSIKPELSFTAKVLIITIVVILIGLIEGIYLLAQIGTVDSGTEQFESAPFLIEVPSEISGRFEYNVETEPKAEWVSKKEPPVVPNQPGDTPEKTPGKKEPVSSNPISDMIDKVKTGDETTFITWICVAFLMMS